jgi:N-acyl-D-aspartate/D-glutamate deacylase
MWDSRLAPSSWHGVTTIVMGNCGVGFAPVRKDTQDAVIALMEGVEDIPGPCLHEGLDWSWESFADYLTALERRSHDIDFCALLPHAPLRVYVMGDRALKLEDANQADIAQMREIAAEAVRAGAFGFSTSRTIAHKTLGGDPTPTLRAQEAELTGIAMGLKDAGKGFIEMTSDWNTPDPATEFAMVRRVMQACGRPLVFSLNQRHDRTTEWQELLALSTQAAADGLPVRCVAPPRPIGALLGLSGSQQPFAGTRSYRSIAHLPLKQRVAAMRDPDVRRRITTEDPSEFNTWSLLTRIGWERMFRFTDPLNYTPAREDSVAAIAAREGRTPQDVAYDMLIEDDGKGFIFACIVNYANYDLEPVKEMYARQHVIPGLSDGGAHVAFISDASFPTFLFSYWGRDRGADRMDIPDLVRRQTREPARFAGLSDRGVLAPGMKADINVIDFANLALERPQMVVDLPAGGRRLMQKARGYAATIKAGQITYRDGVATGALPGGLVRSQSAM